MINLFYGNDRRNAEREIKKLLGSDYEVFDGAELSFSDFPSLFYGTSLLTPHRKILIKDLSENKSLFEKLLDFLDSPHAIILWEKSFDRRTKLNKALASKINLREFKLAEKIDRNLAFNIYDVALRDGVRAVEMLTPLKETEDPFRLLGAWSWKALDNYRRNSGAKEKRVLDELSKIDMKLKSTRFSLQPWTLLQSFLLRLSSL